MEDSFTDKEEDLGAVEEERSVILHLLSQLKLGMDLTRVGRVPISAKTIPLRRQHEQVFDKARLAVTEEDFPGARGVSCNTEFKAHCVTVRHEMLSRFPSDWF